MPGIGLALIALLASPPPGEIALRQVAEAYAGFEFVTAKYTQERSTPLMRTPLKSEGRLTYRRQPLTLLLQTARTTIRFDAARYEVYRPHKGQLERFDVGAERGAEVLSMGFGQRVDRLLERFTITGTEGDAPMVVHLTAKAPDAKVTTLRLTVDPLATRLTALSYAAKTGDTVTFRLTEIALHPTLPAGALEMTYPPETRVIEHRQK